MRSPPMAAPRRSVCVRRDTIVHVLPIVARAAEHAPGIAVVSYAGGMTFGVCADRATVPALDVLTDGIVTLPAQASPAGARDIGGTLAHRFCPWALAASLA
jgi:hypothetical protein